MKILRQSKCQEELRDLGHETTDEILNAVKGYPCEEEVREILERSEKDMRNKARECQREYSVGTVKAATAIGAIGGAIAGGKISKDRKIKSLKEKYDPEVQAKILEDKGKDLENKIESDKKLLKNDSALRNDYESYRTRLKEEFGDGCDDPEYEDLVSDDIISAQKLDPRVRYINLERDEAAKQEYQNEARKIRENPEESRDRYAKANGKASIGGILGGAAIGAGVGLGGSIAAERLIKRNTARKK